MKICVTSQGDNLDSQVDPRFGRCQYFIIVDTETLEFEAIQNSGINAMGGAGIQSAQLVAEKQVKVVLTGNVGPNAFQTLQSAGIDVITGVSGTVKEAVEKYKKAEFKPTEGPSVSSKFGMPGKR